MINESILRVLLTGDSFSAYVIMKECRRRSGQLVRTGDFWRAMTDLESKGLVRRVQRWRGSFPLRPWHEITEAGRCEIEKVTSALAVGVVERSEPESPPVEVE